MASIIRVDGRIEGLPPGKLTLKQLQEAVGGYIQMVRLTPKTWMVVNEEGKLRGQEHNRLATDLYRGFRGSDDEIVGDVVIAMCPEEVD